MRTTLCNLLIMLLGAMPSGLLAQCPVEQMDLKIEVGTDDYGYEGYWQLVPAGNSCGVATIWEGGNDVQVGCSGGGDQDATTVFGYGDNITISENIGCIDNGSYDIKYVDDYGDGGMTFSVILDDIYEVYNFSGTGAGNTFNFEVASPLEYDAGVVAVIVNPYNNPGDVIIKGAVFNYGATIINTLEVAYSIDGGPETVSTITGLNVLPFTATDFVHPISWNILTNGTYNVKLSSGKINGNDDLLSTNDFTSKEIVIGDPIPNNIADYLIFVEEYEIIGEADDEINNPTDLDFHPILTQKQVWITNKGTEGSGGSTVTFWNAGLPSQTSELKKDGNAWHFMSLPTAIAFSENTNFATAPGVKDANHSGGTFTGPTLWSSDMDIYAEPSGGNGSHLDMLHQSPFSMGIAAWKDNAFFVFCDYHGYIHMYDFQEDHGPGNDDHSDGKVWEYIDFDVNMINDDLPSHLVYDKSSNFLYVIDAGNGRIIRMNPESGNVTGTFSHPNEPLAEADEIENTDWVEIVNTGLIEPVGIDVIDNYMLVGDHATGEIIIYDISTVPAVELKRLQTGRTGLMGIKIGPDGLIWFVDQDEDELVRVNITNTVAIPNHDLQNSFSVFPNPSNGIIHVNFETQYQNINVTATVLNQLGEIIYTQSGITGRQMQIDISRYSAGAYTLKLETESGFASKKIIVVK
ncbi:MAG: T9SS type A sorting domain-containing protein [Bacteroidetes bacterium]|jgi:hypothetical protein|nr:T9SS type A sorting domain-containing protein [Bacteroidota bacterium]MBL0280680.1 T9SS type A sorting domain-containing protein [Bacteroidota bacterium]MBP9879805.1 T9SS type A sorting domain-containing protein [Chitinophagales bacterium]